MQRESASELGFGMDSRASISSVKGDSRKDGIGRRVSRTKKIRVEKGKKDYLLFLFLTSILPIIPCVTVSSLDSLFLYEVQSP